MRMIGTGQAPQGYKEGQIFDVADHDLGTIEDLERKGWARRLDPREDPGRDKVSIANAMVRGDDLSDPHDAEIAAEIGSHDKALAIVHGEDPDATPADYEAEAKLGQSRNAIGQPLTEGEQRIHEIRRARVATSGRTFNPDDEDRVDTLEAFDRHGSNVPKAGSDGSDVDATDSAREYARDKGINLADVSGSGADGKVTKADVEKHEQGS